MKSYYFTSIKILSIALFLNSCSNPEFENVKQVNPLGLTNTTFDFSTYREVEITINDADNNTKYDVYAYTDVPYFVENETFVNESNQTATEPIYRNDVLNKLIFTGVSENGVLKQTINVPRYCTKLYVRRNSNLNFSSSVVEIINGEADFNFTETAGRNGAGTSQVHDYLFCVNTSGELFQINPLNGQLTFLSDMPMGSNTCAIDQANKVLYSIGNKSPFPLMKYSITNNTWTTIQNLGTDGPRLAFNSSDGLLYFSNDNMIYTINPTTGVFSTGKTIVGLHNKQQGDLDFANDGTIFLCAASGVYRLQLNQSNVYQSTRINSTNMSFQPTGLIFDSSDNIWLSNNSSNPEIILMNKVTGNWEYKYGKKANNNTEYKRKISDLAIFKVNITTNTIIDSDGDGIQDQDDAFPEDANLAFELFTPSKTGIGTIAFEDLWPTYGDYDFNDVALNYKVIVMLNAQNKAVSMDIICRVKANGAGYTNGIGIEIGNLPPTLIQSVTGTVLTENYITLNANGTEASQQNAVIILTDAARNLQNERKITIKFTQPISTKALGIAPFNPFVIANKARDKEIHLPYASPTSLGDNFIQVVGSNRDVNGDYLSDQGMPWAISFIHDFKVPKEKVNIAQAYNFFIQWANSGGTLYQDWYKDNSGNRNDNQIQN